MKLRKIFNSLLILFSLMGILTIGIFSIFYWISIKEHPEEKSFITALPKISVKLSMNIHISSLVNQYGVFLTQVK